MKSLIAWFVCAAIILFAGLGFYPRFNQTHSESTFGWDVGGYYWYLPASFIYHDLKGEHFADSIIAQYQFTPTFNYGFPSENGGYVLTYSSGMAVLYTPFFAIAHLLAVPMGFPDDGFSQPYQIAITIGSLLVCLLGLWYYRKLLRYYYSDTVCALMLLLLVLGSNYLNYTAIDGALTHNWLFTIYVFIILASRNFYLRFETKYAVAIGLLCGLAVLVRPSEIIAVLIPLLWGLEGLSWHSIRTRFQLYYKQVSKLILAIMCLAMVGSIQLFYWKYVSGHWLVYSYAEKGFSWLRPHLHEYLFSYRSGWLTYTPMMMLCFAGIIPFIKHGKNKVGVLLFFALNLYIVSAWDIWWYGGTGGRAMIQSYPIILFPVASLIEFMLRKKVWLYPAVPFIFLATYANIWFSIQAHGGAKLYDPDGMSKAYFWQVVGRWHVSPEIERLKDATEIFSGSAAHYQLVYQSDPDSNRRQNPMPENERPGMLLNAANPRLKEITFSLPDNDAGWLRVQARFQIAQKEWTAWKMTQFIVQIKHQGNVVNEQMLRVQRYLSDGGDSNIHIDIRIPRPAKTASIHFWNPGSDAPIWISSIKAWTFREATDE
ncbi:MAG: hypothetical protein JST06_01975 [Bacteroidetes bacterium]|nr:hypothetical protein [Bacteroidota bacterium]MBS1630089.1 hypothetical protein [Bacteroidota bacterium]